MPWPFSKVATAASTYDLSSSSPNHERPQRPVRYERRACASGHAGQEPASVRTAYLPSKYTQNLENFKRNTGQEHPLAEHDSASSKANDASSAEKETQQEISKSSENK